MVFQLHQPYRICFFVVSLLAVALATEDNTGPRPGDVFDYNTHVYPQWWFDLKEQYGYKEIRKCPFLHEIPDTFDSCPSVAKHTDHYYCLFGTETEPTWFCTCVENVEGEGSDYHFHCSDQGILTVELVEHLASESIVKAKMNNATASIPVTKINNATAIPPVVINATVKQPTNNTPVQSKEDTGNGIDDNNNNNKNDNKKSKAVSAKSVRHEELIKSAPQSQESASSNLGGSSSSKGSFTYGFASGIATGVGVMLVFPAIVFLILTRSKRTKEQTEFEYPTQTSIGKLNESWISTDDIMGRMG